MQKKIFIPHNPDLMTLKEKPFENIMGKGESAGYQHSLLFDSMFLTHPKENLFLNYIYFVVCKCLLLGLVQKFVFW